MLNSYLPCIVNNAEVCFVLQLSWLLELGMSSLLLDQFFHKCLVSSFREPAFFIQQCQHTRRICLKCSLIMCSCYIYIYTHIYKKLNIYIYTYICKFNISNTPLKITIRVVQNNSSPISVKTSCGGIQVKKDAKAGSNNLIPVFMEKPLSWSRAAQSLAL